uniref:Uncharacterized protein n=1 Tax=Tetranychus urticae TaxID=32264 RepID=T1KSW3_TETUR
MTHSCGWFIRIMDYILLNRNTNTNIKVESDGLR